MRRLTAIAFLFATSQAWALSFGFYSPVTVDHTQVPSTQTDFPVLIIGLDNRFKSVGNGGHVQSSSGFDIRPYSDSALTTALTYQLVYFKPATGEFEMWVKESSLSSSVDTVIYMAYGESSLTTDGSSTSTWSNSYGAVWHLKDGTTLTLTDSTATANNLSFSTSHATPTPAQIDGGATLASASAQTLSASAFNATALTYSIWAKGASFPAAYNDPIIHINSGGTQFDLIAVKSTGKLRWGIRASGAQLDADGTGTATLSTNTWYYLVLAYDSTNGLKAYVNATIDKTLAANGTASTLTEGVDIGGTTIFGSQYWNGALDEIHLASVARSADWITTEYHNQGLQGAGFYSIGTEVSNGAANKGWFYFFP